MMYLLFQILKQSWKSERIATASHPRYYGALATEVDFAYVSIFFSLPCCNFLFFFSLIEFVLKRIGLLVFL